MRKKLPAKRLKSRLDGHPANIRQALHLAAAIIARIEKKRLDISSDEGLISTASEPCGDNNEN